MAASEARRLGAGWEPALFAAQGYQGVDAHGSQGGDGAGDECGGQEDAGHGSIRGGIGGADFEELRR